VIESLKTALNSHKINNAIFHTARGSQYTSDEFRNYLSNKPISQSMNSSAGRCHDNAKYVG
ncbi:MAG: IS3 family transposase, partial [Clostridiales bacterium]|nr:IS3 family transposase [Clostridiales bacterium]